MTLRNVHAGTDAGQAQIIDIFKFIFAGFDVLVVLDTPPALDSAVDHFIKTQLRTRPGLYFEYVQLDLAGEDQVMLKSQRSCSYRRRVSL